MNDFIGRIERATDQSIMPLIALCLKSSLIAESWNNHDVGRGATAIDFEYNKRLREVSIAKLESLGVPRDKMQKWYDAFTDRIESFGCFKDYICSKIIDETISLESLSRLFSKNNEIFNNELNRIADEYSDLDCAIAREAGYDTCVPRYNGEQLRIIKKQNRD